MDGRDEKEVMVNTALGEHQIVYYSHESWGINTQISNGLSEYFGAV